MPSIDVDPLGLVRCAHRQHDPIVRLSGVDSLTYAARARGSGEVTAFKLASTKLPLVTGSLGLSTRSRTPAKPALSNRNIEICQRVMPGNDVLISSVESGLAEASRPR
jgi:hypothetical protein